MTCANLTPPSLAAPLLLQRFSRQELIQLSPNVLWRIESGVVRTATWSEEGILIILGYWSVGNLVGMPLTRVMPYLIECLTAVEVSQLKKDLWYQEFDSILKQIQQIEELQTIVHQNSVELRLWRLLNYLGERFGQDVKTGRLIDLPLTHELLAQTISATRVTVTRLLQQFEAQGKLQRNGRQLILQTGC